MSISLRSTGLVLICIGGVAPQALSSGFQLREQSPSAQGNAFAGISAGNSDISSMFFNPATMTAFMKNEVVAGVSFVAPYAQLRDAQSSTASGPPVTGNAGSASLLPSLYAMWNLSPDLKLGFSMNVPFGMCTEYDSDFVGRYHALKSNLWTVDLSPSLAYRISPQWSVGGAIVARRAKAQLTNAVNVPGDVDGYADLHAEAWGFGYRLGVTWQPTPQLRVGLGYQSSVVEKLRGDVGFQIPSPYTRTYESYGFRATHVGTDLKLPSTLSLGCAYGMTENLSVQIEVARTEWSPFKTLDISFYDNIAENLVLQHSITEENWRNTWFLALGTSWKASDAWTLRFGIAHDQSACKDAYRTPRMPDCDRDWISAGAAYAFAKAWRADLALTHLFCGDGSLNLVDTSSKGNLSGRYKNHIDLASISLRYTF